MLNSWTPVRKRKSTQQVSLSKSVLNQGMSKRYRSGKHYGWASDSAIRSAGGYRSGITGSVYTRDILAAKGGSSGFVDKNIGQNMTSDTAQVSLLFTCAQGTTTQERIGRKLRITSLQFRAYITPGTGASAKWDHAYMYVVYDKRPTQALPTLAEIQESAASTALTNENGFDRFKILKRWDYMVIGNENAVANLTDKSCYNVKKYMKVGGKKGLPVSYMSNTAGLAGTIAGITEGAIYLVVGGAHANGLGLHSILTGNCRVRFRDVLS